MPGPGLEHRISSTGVKEGGGVLPVELPRLDVAQVKKDRTHFPFAMSMKRNEVKPSTN